jgi:EAL domain-containing protein (putative c-di-GMP-specific phosphodiesterase class I)
MPIRAVAARHDMPTPADILAVLRDGRISMVYQSIVDLRSPAIATPQVIGYEALARFPNGSPPDWFKLAGSAGVGTDLELLALRAGIEGFVTNDQHTVLALNLSNSALLSPRLIQALRGIDPGRVVLELSDTARIHSYEVTRRAVDGLRERGIRLAVDDVGAGEIDMWHILRLNPDLLKLDRHLVADQDNVQRNNALIRGLATMASELGILVIAEAIETEAERHRLLELGVEFGQGYLFGKPEPLQWKTRILGD